ncbi:ATP-dependent DNA helicase [Candidatus Magnetomoraceae bacterium gMMP-1]
MKKNDIELVLQEGEGYLIEFKEKMKNLDKEMVAFANGSGGRIFLGISDKGEIKGKIRFDELMNLKFMYDIHFDENKLHHFLALSGISKVMDTTSILLNLGVAEQQERKIIFNNTGILFFAKNLNDIYFHTTITCALYKGTDKVTVLDRKDFNEDIVSNVDSAMIFLKTHIPIRYEFDGSPKRIEIPEIPFGALREAVINAIVHRNYFEKGANVMVEIFDDRIEISSPGELVKGLSKRDFGKKSVLRNANIANLFHRMGYIEKMGTGINRMQNLMKKAGRDPINFQFTTFVTAIFKRAKTSGKTSGKIIKIISKNSDITIPELSKKLEKTSRAIEMQIAKLKKEGCLKRVGPAKGGYWEII